VFCGSCRLRSGLLGLTGVCGTGRTSNLNGPLGMCVSSSTSGSRFFLVLFLSYISLALFPDPWVVRLLQLVYLHSEVLVS
jgi:hypothetical protein